jgi:hypothetical protein
MTEQILTFHQPLAASQRLSEATVRATMGQPLAHIQLRDNGQSY